MQGIVVDPGGDVPAIVEAIDKTGVEVCNIVLTHGHIDHAGGASELRQHLGVDIIGPGRQDQWLLDSLEETGRQYGMSGVRNVSPDRWLEEGDAIAFGDITFAVLHCPGHTPGHMVLVAEDLRLGVFGDVLFKGSIGRTDFPRGDHEALINSIKTKLLPLGDDFAFLCGHGPASTIGEERRNNPFLQ